MQKRTTLGFISSLLDNDNRKLSPKECLWNTSLCIFSAQGCARNYKYPGFFKNSTSWLCLPIREKYIILGQGMIRNYLVRSFLVSPVPTKSTFVLNSSHKKMLQYCFSWVRKENSMASSFLENQDEAKVTPWLCTVEWMLEKRVQIR